MRELDRDGRRLCIIQAELFEQSIKKLKMSSEVFVRRFMNSNIVCELDNSSFLEDSKTIDDIFDSLNKQYGELNYGSVKYHRDVMYWAGYLYRQFSYTYKISSKQAYKMLPLKYVASTFEPYHTLDISQAIERLLESKNISFNDEDMVKKGVVILRNIRKASFTNK